jgi:putative aminopeptidase FrvX
MNFKNKIDMPLEILKKIFYFIFFISITSYSQESLDEQKLLLIEALKEFSETSSVTGREDNASEYLKSFLKNSNLKEDKLGNLILEIGSGLPKTLITVPIDEPGYVISEIKPNGYMRFTPVGFGRVGKLYDQFMQGHEVKINSEKKYTIGVSTVPSSHFESLRKNPESKKEPFTWHEGYIDIGASSIEEVYQNGIELLDPVSLNKKPVVINDSLIAAPNIKIKAAGLALAVIAKFINKKSVKGKLVFAWTVQELINGKGIESVINKYGPFDKTYRFNRFLDSDSIGTDQIIVNEKFYKDESNIIKVKPILSFRNSASNIDFDKLKIYEIGIASKYSNSPVEMIAINDVINLISYISNSQKIQLSHYYDFPDKKKQKKTLFKSYSEYESILGELINKYGVSTSENSVRNHIIKKLPSWAKPIVDEKGNLILTFGEGENHKVFVAHMDETGYIVNDIKNDGRLELKMLGGMLPWLWEAQPATIHLRHKKITGVFEPRLDYLTSKKRKSNFPLNVNAGFLSKSEALEAGVIIGETTITMPKEMIRLNENRVTGRSFDDRVGCAALILALNKINPRELKNKITFVWSVEEEIGLRGAKHSAINLKNASIVYPVDTYVSSDDPYKDESFANAPLGNGAVIRVLESINFVSRENFKMIRKLADNNNIKTQYGMTSGGTDGQPFLSYGIPSVPISWPGRYSHSPIEIMDLRDMNSLVKLIKAVIED